MVSTPKPAAPVAAPPELAPVALAAEPSAWPLIGRAIAMRIAAPRPARNSGTSLLDFILVVGALVLIGGGLYGLFTIKDIPKETLPIIASVLSFICGSILGAYAGYRWGASDAMKKANASAPS